MNERSDFYESLFLAGKHKSWDDAPGKQVLIGYLLKKGIGSRPSTTVLDVGCGTGYFLDKVRDIFGGVVCKGCDIAEAAISKAKSTYPACDFMVGNAHDLPYENSSFDVVLSYGVFEHVSKPDKAIREASRVLTRHGRFAFMIPTIGHYRKDRTDEGWYEDLNDPPQMQWNYFRVWWERLFNDADLSLEPMESAKAYGAINPGNFYFGMKP